MDQAELEIQLKAWKDLAISNQILMRTATDALKLDSECSTVELKTALDTAIKRSLDSDAAVERAQQQSQQAIAVMEKKTAACEKAQATAEAIKEETLATLKQYEQQMVAERADHANEQKKIKAQLTDKDNALKAINKALADTPENVMKKLRTLKKQKNDEATARKQAEESLRSLRKDKKQLEQSVKESEEKLEDQVKQYRELHELCTSLHEQLKPLVDDEKTLPSIPELEEESSEEEPSKDDKKTSKAKKK